MNEPVLGPPRDAEAPPAAREEPPRPPNPSWASVDAGGNQAAALRAELPLRFGFIDRGVQRVRDYFLAYDPTLSSAFAPLLLLVAMLYLRWPTTNFIFDEQEALLANPYVNASGGLRFIDAIHRDFWGLPADASVGSYRPVPNFLWRLLWNKYTSQSAFVFQLYNVILHALNGALMVVLAFMLTKRRGLSWLAGALFASSAVLTETVSGLVGLADVLGGLGAILALLALALPAWSMPFAVFAAVLFGLFSKESGLVVVPLVPFAAVVFSPLLHTQRPARFLRGALALAGSVGAFILYVELRKRWFTSPLPEELRTPLPDTANWLQRGARAFLVWFHQAPLPKDPLNNPLAKAATPLRIAGALRVYLRGLGQVLFPKTLSGDYSFPQEPVPKTPWGWESVLGGALMVLPLAGGALLWLRAWAHEKVERKHVISTYRTWFDAPESEAILGDDTRRERRYRILGAAFVGLAVGGAALQVFVLRPRGLRFDIRGVPWWWLMLPVSLLALGMLAESGKALPRLEALNAPVPLPRAACALLGVGLVWMVVSYFPHSNIPIVLPTVRAERFWYYPVIGTSLVLAATFSLLHAKLKPRNLGAPLAALVALFFGFHWVQSYRHAMDYRNDLVFWEATKTAVPNSAKAHLNYSVMRGARNQMEIRLAESRRAMELAPEWAMAHIYTGDTLCRMDRADEAWPHYQRGLDLGPNDKGLISLALQCMHDKEILYKHEEELQDIADRHDRSWVAYLVDDTLKNAEKNKGVDPEHRPRSYNQGPKKE